jgi:hypothetical protein
MELLADRGVDATWRRSIAEALAVIELLDERIAPLERELRQAARDDQRVVLPGGRRPRSLRESRPARRRRRSAHRRRRGGGGR